MLKNKKSNKYLYQKYKYKYLNLKSQLNKLYGGSFSNLKESEIYINAIIIPSGNGKPTLSKKYSEFLIDIDSIINTKEYKDIMKKLRRSALESFKNGNKNAWKEVNNMNGELFLKEIKENPEIINKIFLIHSPDMFGTLPLKINILANVKLDRSEIDKVVEDRRKIDPLWAELTLNNWNDNNSPELSRSEMITIIENVINKFRTLSMESTKI